MRYNPPSMAPGSEKRDVRSAVLAAIARVQADRGDAPAAASDEDVLGDTGLGLDSLDMATIVAGLEAVLHRDPFADAVPRLRTVGDLVRLYEEAAE